VKTAYYACGFALDALRSPSFFRRLRSIGTAANNHFLTASKKAPTRFNPAEAENQLRLTQLIKLNY
jgi:hypothetical protein